MEESEDKRWRQRFSSFKQAWLKLEESMAYIKRNPELMKLKLETNSSFSTLQQEMAKESVIQRFEYTHELAWNLFKDFAAFQGYKDIKGSRDATRVAFKMNLIEFEDLWMDMIKSRNNTSHIYNEEIAHEIFENVVRHYFTAFKAFAEKMHQVAKDYE